MGPLCFDHMCVVADIVYEVLLGEDLLSCDFSGPTDIIQSEEKKEFKWAFILPKMARHVTIDESV